MRRYRKFTGAPYSPLYRAYEAAENAWQAELVRLFGKRAGDVRYTTQAHGTAGTKLADLYAAYLAARTAWHVERDERTLANYVAEGLGENNY